MFYIEFTLYSMSKECKRGNFVANARSKTPDTMFADGHMKYHAFALSCSHITLVGVYISRQFPNDKT